MTPLTIEHVQHHIQVSNDAGYGSKPYDFSFKNLDPTPGATQLLLGEGIFSVLLDLDPARLLAVHDTKHECACAYCLGIILYKNFDRVGSFICELDFISTQFVCRLCLCTILKNHDLKE